ncbi:succinyl-coa ligase ADP-forming subunit beta [Fusarium flagelliforme]|uniref:Succinyl-coa ligase ADP-forming subunit beta n=2 Tax=Fusarium flagelliforme TaxID=2675880 RepID=A0A395MWZ0_9HYPO|nr:succinyl-coa ligase ADP-forming subunit beta [Fusarium flagelliforme]
MTIDRKTCTPVIKIRDLQDPVKLPDGSYSGMQYHFELKDGEERLAPFVANFAGRYKLGKMLRESFNKVLSAVYGIFTKCQALSLEVDLLRQMGDKRFICVNSHFEFDDDAPKRARKIYSASREVLFEVQAERFAEIHGFVYVKMSDGNIGTVVNGAGLAMSTTDAIQQYGGQSNNFLDVGGQATTETMQKAFRVVMSDPKVKVVIINIYGGITKCDMIAESIIAAAKDYLIGVEVVVRLQGTNAEAGLKMIEDANLGFHVESGFATAASKAVELSKAVKNKPISPKRLAALDRLGPLNEKELWDNEKLEKGKKRKATKVKQKRVREREIKKKAREREEREAEIRRGKLERDAAKAKAKAEAEEANKTW